jgi:hypothetical protein
MVSKEKKKKVEEEWEFDDEEWEDDEDDEEWEDDEDW